MQNGEKLNVEQIRALLEATGEVQFAGENREEIYEWVTQMLCHQEYFRQKRRRCGVCCGSTRCA